LLAAILWGTTGTAQSFAPAGAAPLAVGAIRLIVGGTALLAVAMTRGVLFAPRAQPLAATMAAAGIAAYQVCFFASVAATGVAVGTVVAIGSAPIFAGILGLLGHGERPGAGWLLATALAVTGCVLLVTAGENITVHAQGVLLALGAGAAYAIYAAASKRLLEEHAPDAVMAVAFSLGAVLLSPVLLTVDLTWLADPRGILVELHLGLIATALAYALFARGLQTISVATAVTLSLVEPLTAAMLGLLVVGERLTASGVIGVGLLATGLLVLSAERVERSATHQ
jgi:DME family drug/metabolite transporter